ncbi:MAG: hypothetical protein H7329_11470 [Opitutaceae bacterium]|nr:hypothetical protein [Cytophagales bacterium]
MKNSILLIAVASVFALASCGGEKKTETSSVDTMAVSTMDSSAVVATDSSSMMSDSSSMMKDSSMTK